MNLTVTNLAAWQEGKAAGADLVALPEMFLTGYQAQDLVRKPAFVADALTHIEQHSATYAELIDGMYSHLDQHCAHLNRKRSKF